MTNDPDKPATKPPAFVSIRMRRWMQYLFGAPAVAALLVMFLVWKFPDLNFLSLPLLPLYAMCAAVVVGYLAMTFLTWRCPLCNGFFGRDLHPEKCATCGVYLED
jgi:hypothetical protein